MSDKGFSKLARDAYWPSMHKDYDRYVLSCPQCQRYKTSSRRRYGLLRSFEVPQEQGQSIALDLVTSLPPSGQEHYDAILVITDRLTRLVALAPCHKKSSAHDIAELFIFHWWKHHGLPLSLVADRDPRWCGKFWESFSQLLQLNWKLSTKAHPQTNGLCERQNQTAVELLRTACAGDPEWHLKLPAVQFAMNDTISQSLGVTPFFAHYGKHPRNIIGMIDKDVEYSPLAADLADKLKQTLASVREALIDAQDKRAERENRHRRTLQIDVGAKVYVSREHCISPRERERDLPRKLQLRWFGPFEVTKKVNPNAFEVSFPSTFQCSKTVNVSNLKLAVDDQIFGRPQRPPAVDVDASGQELFVVGEILDHRPRKPKTARTKLQYLIRWHGYGPDDDSWVPERDLQDAEVQKMIQAYKRKKKLPQ